MKIVEKGLEELKPYENNPRVNDDAVEFVANSIKEFGFKVPIVVDKDGVIVAGHTRYKAAESLGMKKVPCIIAEDLTDEQVKAYRIADNKVADRAYWDNEKLGKEISEIMDDVDMTDFGFGAFELDMLTTDMEPEGYDEEVEHEYSGNEQEYLAKRRVIISYKPEEEEEVKKLLGLDEINKVVYDVEELC